MTEEEMDGCIVIHYDEAYSQYVYNYSETNCSELNTLPVITLTGESTITIGVGETYTELGATASYQDTDVTSSIKITDNIDNSKVGTYQVRYNVTYNGVSAREVVRTVKVVDKSPVITLKGNSTITIGLNQTYTDEGATAKTYDGTDISSSIVVTSDVDTTKAGTYTVRYNVTHDGKSAKEVTRTVTVVDKNPVIVLSQDSTTGYEQSVSINVTVTPYEDNTISSIKYKLNGGSEQSVSNNAITLNTTGTHTIEVIATDNKGNVGTITSGTYQIDADKPTIALEVLGDSINDNGWSNEDITLNVTTSDTGGSSVSSYQYCYGDNCTPNITGTGNMITISDESTTNYVCAVSIDGVGNESEKVCVGPYKIDKTISEPTITATKQANSNGWYKENINLNITASNDNSGINSIKYCKTNTGTTCTPNTSIMGTSGTVTIDTDSATNYVCAVNIDNAGNKSTTKCTVPYALDKTGPTLTVPSDTTIKLTEVTGYDLLDGVSATDDISDIDGKVTTSGNLRAEVGEYTITYTVSNKAGHTASGTRVIKVVEAEGPIVSLSKINTNDEYAGIQSIMLTVNDDSGIKSLSYQITKDGQALDTVNVTVDGSNHAEDTISLSESGIYSIHVVAIDKNNNETTLDSGTYQIDADKPTVSLAVAGNPFNDLGWSKTDVTLNVTTGDTGGSLVNSYKYCTGNNCTPSITGTGNTITISDEGENNYVCAIAIDNAGNESEKVCVGPYKIDKTISEPTITAANQANNNGWYKEDVNLNIITGADTSGISSIKYCKTESTTCTPNTSITGTSGTVTIDTESSTNYVCALSIDKTGNESTTKCTGPYALDKTKPILTLPADATIKVTEVTNYDLLAGVSATDGLSQLDGSVTTSGDFRAEVGEYIITYTVSDKAGNTVSDTRVITVVEADGPIVSLDKLNTNDKYVGVQSITLTANDTSGVKSLSYRITKDGQALDTVNVTVDGSNHAEDMIELSESGTYSIHVISTDAHNNETVLDSGTYYIDVDDPTISLSVSGNPFNDAGWSKTDVTLNVTTSDTGGSEVSSYKYCIGNNCTPSITGTGNTITISTEGENVYACAVSIDGAENESEKVCVGPYKIDKTISEPTIEAAKQANSNGWYKEDIGLNITATDNLSGINNIQYCETSDSTTCTPNDSVPKTTTVADKMESSSEVASLDPDGNLRYVGADPDNYVSFNGELWRIIGVFNGQTKIIRNDYYSTSTKWDASYNNWAEADLQATLNGTYLTSIQTNDPTSYSYIDLTHVWNIGGATSTTSTWTRSSMYSLERGSTTAGASGSKATWTGAIGLMYPSDYGYSTSGAASTCDTTMYNWDSYSTCYSNSWLYDSSYAQWTLTPRSGHTHSVFGVYAVGGVYGNDVSSTDAARPVLFLKSDVVITGGKGTDQEPYQLGKGVAIDTESATNYVCATATDNAGNESTTKCVGPYALDKTAPILTVPEDVTIKVSEVASYNLLTGASATDDLSDIDGSITTSGSLSAVIGNYTITYTVKDKAGNTASGTRTITVKSDAVTFTEKMQSSSEVASLDPGGNLRYVGQNPSNYVSFNGELWRIIGVFDGQTKIIRNDYYSTSTTWDSDYNNWAEADLQATLNGTYLASIQTNDPTSYSYIDLTHVWNIGAALSDTSTWTRANMYSLERGSTTAGASGSKATWTGAIGLMYPSDYGYSTSGAASTCDTTMYNWDSYSTCYSNSWLYDSSQYQWTLTPRSDSTFYVFYVDTGGFVGNYGYVGNDNAARPVLYLKSDVGIVDGNGTDQEPFILAQ